MEEVQGQHAVLRDCIEQLTAVESSRANLVSHLREALQEQVGWQTQQNIRIVIDCYMRL